MILVRRSTGQIYAKSNNREYLERLREKYEARDILCDIEELLEMTEPKITKTDKGWRVDLPDGDFCYQPSQNFAISYARQWQVANNMQKQVANKSQ